MAARDQDPDLIVLDWMMPGLSGIEVCRRLRQTGSQTPIILLTAKDDISDRVEGLDAGADDYVVKPFSIEELLARVRAHLRRHEPQEADSLVFGDLTLNRKSREVVRGHRQHRTDRQRVRPVGLFNDQPEAGADSRSHPGRSLGLRLHGRLQHHRSVYPLLAAEARGRGRATPDPDRARSRLRVARLSQSLVKPIPW
jgi:chemotaxis response regulator CheB